MQQGVEAEVGVADAAEAREHRVGLHPRLDDLPGGALDLHLDAGLLRVGGVGERVVLADLVPRGVEEGERGAPSVLGADAVRAGLPAGLVQDALGPGEVVRALDAALVPGVVDGQRAVRRPARAVEDPVDHGLAVHGGVQGPADGAVPGDLVRGGQGDGPEVVGPGPVGAPAVVLLEGGGQVGRQDRAVEVAGAQPGGAYGVVGDDGHGERLHRGLVAPVVRVGLEGELLALAPVGEHVRTGADRLGVEVAGVGVLPARDVLGDDGQDGAGGEGRVGVLEREDDGAVPARADVLDGVEFAAGGVVGLLVEDGAVRVDDVLGRQGFAVAELHAVAQGVRVRPAAVGDLRQRGGERGLQIQVGVAGEQPVEDLGVAVLAVAQQRAEGVRFRGHPDHDGRGVPGVAVLAAVRGRGAGGRTGGQCHRRGGAPYRKVPVAPVVPVAPAVRTGPTGPTGPTGCHVSPTLVVDALLLHITRNKASSQVGGRFLGCSPARGLPPGRAVSRRTRRTPRGHGRRRGRT